MTGRLKEELTKCELPSSAQGPAALRCEAHTAMALECPDGTRLLLDAGSGNSALRHANAVGIHLREFDDVLLSHDHPDHMAGIEFIQFDRALFARDSGPLRVHASYEALEGLKRHCLASRLNIWDVSGDFGSNKEGLVFLQWCPSPPRKPIELGPANGRLALRGRPHNRCFWMAHRMRWQGSGVLGRHSVQPISSLSRRGC